MSPDEAEISTIGWSGIPGRDQLSSVESFLADLYRKVVRIGGTISGEHGIGRKRAKSLTLALSPSEIEALQAVKTALDPNNVLNPGVVLPAG